MVHLYLCELVMVHLWVRYGSFIGHSWAIYGSFMGYLWFICGTFIGLLMAHKLWSFKEF